MLSQSDNELICRVGPGTPMGELMRQYWIPALAVAASCKADGAPVRVMLLGEKLIAFRDTRGPRRLMDHRLPASRRLAVLRPQRGGRAALRLSRLEVRRRPATASTCRTCRRNPDFKDKVRAKAYQAVERDGVVWAYMGAAARRRRLPALLSNLHPRGRGRYQRLPARTATGSKRSRATSTLRMPASCMAACSAGARQRARTASRAKPRRSGTLRPAALRLYRQALQVRGLGDRLGRDVRRLPPGRRRHQLLAAGAVHLSVLDHHADLADRGSHLAARLGAARRHCMCVALRDQPQAVGPAAVARRRRRQVPAEYYATGTGATA